MSQLTSTYTSIHSLYNQEPSPGLEKIHGYKMKRLTFQFYKRQRKPELDFLGHRMQFAIWLSLLNYFCPCTSTVHQKLLVVTLLLVLLRWQVVVLHWSLHSFYCVQIRLLGSFNVKLKIGEVLFSIKELDLVLFSWANKWTIAELLIYSAWLVHFLRESTEPSNFTLNLLTLNLDEILTLVYRNYEIYISSKISNLL